VGRLFAGLCAVFLAAGLGACSDPPWRTKDVSGLMPPLEFELRSDDGRQVTAEDYRGKVSLVFFGYTHCPDVCPTTLARLTEVAAQLDDPGEVRVLFITVDPARDTTERLHAYARAFGPRVVGLRGERAALDALTKRYRVTYGYGEPDASGNYLVSHSSAVYAFDREGEIRLLIRDSDPLDDVVADLKRLVAAGSS